LDCTVARTLCVGWAHESGEYSPAIDVHWWSGDSFGQQPNLFTHDVTWTVNQPVHVGVRPLSCDDYGDIWVDGTKRFSYDYWNMWSPYNGANCSLDGTYKYYVTTLSVDGTIRVQFRGLDTLAQWAKGGYNLTFWYNAATAPAGWPENLVVTGQNN